MAATKVTLRNISAESCAKLAWRTARDLHFRVTEGNDARRFIAEKGHLGWALLAGAVWPYNRLVISAEPYDDGTTDLIVERNTTWIVQGLMGVRQVKTNAETLLSEILIQIESAGGVVVSRKEI